MATGVYVGVISDVHSYESDEDLNTSFLANWFTITNGDYYFEAEDEMTEFVSNNSGVKNSTATTTLTAKYNCDIEFHYYYSTEEDYDKFSLVIAGNTIENKVSGERTDKSWIGSLTAGQSIVLTYTKDSSTNSNDDKCGFSISMIRRITSTTKKPAARKVKNIYVGVDGVARRIKKGYIGVGGIARLCYITPGVHHYGTTTALSVARQDIGATTVGNYALFAGGVIYDGSSGLAANTVDAYNTSLTRSVPTALRVASSSVATTVGNYALFTDNTEGYVDAYNTSLTRSAPTALSVARFGIGATTVGNYALFAGGVTIDTFNPLTRVDAYNTSLTRSKPTALSVARVHCGITTVGNYALIAGGSITVGYGQDNVYSSVDAYNTSLTRSIAPELSIGRNYLAAASSNGYAIFAGGQWSYNSDGKIVDAYDSSLVRSILTQLNVGRHSHAMASINQYVLVAGGRISSSPFTSTNSVEVYMCLQQ